MSAQSCGRYQYAWQALNESKAVYLVVLWRKLMSFSLATADLWAGGVMNGLEVLFCRLSLATADLWAGGVMTGIKTLILSLFTSYSWGVVRRGQA